MSKCPQCQFTLILIAMVNLAVIAELCNTTKISDISIWHYKKYDKILCLRRQENGILSST